MSDVRLVTIINDLEKTLLDFVQRHQITHHEYRVATDVLVAGAQAGHGAILLDILLEAETLDGQHVVEHVEPGELQAVLETLVARGVKSLSSRPPTLEELFLRHYQ